MDDKHWVILCTTAIAIISFVYPDIESAIAQNVITGLFGVAIGRGLKE